MADQSLPEPDSKILAQAYRVASEAVRETNPIRRAVLEDFALDLWRQAHQARRDALYARGARQ
jgi:hypothetical protein